MSFNTDFPDVAPCNRNNCRCGDNKNCMYYNSPGLGHSHYNYVAVQGAGAPSDPAYRCASKAFDYFNKFHMYGDHAVGGLGTYAEIDGKNQQAGNVQFGDECVYGKRDLCDRQHYFGYHPFKYQPEHKHDAMCGCSEGGFYHSWLKWVVAAALVYGFYKGFLNLNERRTQIILIALAAFYLFFSN